MNFMDAVEHVFINYANFNGGARRSEYWYFQLFQFLVLFGLVLLSLTGILSIFLFLMGAFIPNLAVSWRRFHDVGRSGWWHFISCIPIAGWILKVIWLAQDSEPGNNRYGPNPKGVGNEIIFGRESLCAVRMPEGTPGISRRHACIRWQQGMPMLIDLGSSFGTYLADGKQLPPNYPEPVAAGTRFFLGNRGNMFQIIVF